MFSSGNAVNIKRGSFGSSEVDDLGTRSEVGSPAGALLMSLGILQVLGIN